MIQINTFRCHEGCQRQSAAPLDKFKCCTHELPWVMVEGGSFDMPTAADYGAMRATFWGCSPRK
jgi:hypothetical protein